MKVLLASLIALGSISPVFADEYQPGYSASRSCFKTEYREEYVPGNEDSPGYVKSWKDTVEVTCEERQVNVHTHGRPQYSRRVTVYEDVDENSCVEGSLLGGILGGGIGAATPAPAATIASHPICSLCVYNLSTSLAFNAVLFQTRK